MQNVLLLNASYEPLDLITVRRAVNLLLSEKVHAVEGVARRMRSVSRVIEVPSVVRLSYYVNVPRRDMTWSRRAVLERDNWQCIYCGVKAGDTNGRRSYSRTDFTLDHIIPRSRGGHNSWGNTACACTKCNHRKADRTPHEAGMKMRFEPKTPRRRMVVVRGHVPTEWVKYFPLD
ncbi:MAG TPA: HNH endonuclease [Anaerolineae bacterium]|nr:HNH endonuclease [Anaerolineae bacterium]